MHDDQMQDTLPPRSESYSTNPKRGMSSHIIPNSPLSRVDLDHMSTLLFSDSSPFQWKIYFTPPTPHHAPPVPLPYLCYPRNVNSIRAIDPRGHADSRGVQALYAYTLLFS